MARGAVVLYNFIRVWVPFAFPQISGPIGIGLILSTIIVYGSYNAGHGCSAGVPIPDQLHSSTSPRTRRDLNWFQLRMQGICLVNQIRISLFQSD